MHYGENREPQLQLSNKLTAAIYCGGRTSLYLQLASHLLERTIVYLQSNSLKVKKTHCPPCFPNQTKPLLHINFLSSKLLVNSHSPYSDSYCVIVWRSAFDNFSYYIFLFLFVLSQQLCWQWHFLLATASALLFVEDDCTLLCVSFCSNLTDAVVREQFTLLCSSCICDF